MDNKLPSTPADVLVVSFSPLRLVIYVVTRLAEILGFWTRPLKNAAAASEEMNSLDTLYWIHKSRNPIAQSEEMADEPDWLKTGYRHFDLPQDFEQHHTLTIGAGGDILRSAGIDDSKDILFENVQDLLFDQDISYANFESPVTDQDLVDEVIGDKGPPIECCSKAQFDVLKGHKGRGFNVLHTANNHMFDMGTEGIETTLKTLEQEAVLDVGTNRTVDQYGKAKIMVKNGIKLGFVSDCFGLNGRQLPKGDHHRIHVSKLVSKHAPPDLNLLQRQIDDCKEHHCDFIIASVHWGFEFEFFPREAQVKAARSLVEYGADCIISHHPHVIQPVEIYNPQRDPNRAAVIAYSLGSLTWGFMAPHIVLSTILNLKLTKGTTNGDTQTYIDDVRATPVFRTYCNENGKMITRIEKLADHTGPDGSTLPEPYIAKIKQHSDLVLGQECLSRGKSD